jgi:hypothetical protein
MYMNVPAASRDVVLEPFAGIAALESVEAVIVQAIMRGEQLTDELPHFSIADGAPVFLSISSRDLAKGLLNLKDDPPALADWAGFILIMSEHLKFDRPGEHSDRLLAAIWQLAFGAPVSGAMIRLAESVVSRFPNR